MIDKNRIAPLFSGWDETLIRSYLQGHMGYALANDEENPTAAQIVMGDFCFIAGVPDDALAARAASWEIAPQNKDWCACIERVWGDGVNKHLRYAIKNEPDVFDTKRLAAFTRSMPIGFSLRPFDAKLCAQSRRERWSKDFCALFDSDEDFLARGLGMAVVFDGQIVSGASSYCIFDGGIEIEIDTKPEFRERGFATACGAALILECLERGLYPSWDAYDLRSVSLAEKLGYHMDHPYLVYDRINSET
jgi:GNAT superfamily N-acetyltransferase